MALVRQATCPTCGQVYSKSVSSYEYGRAHDLISQCGECAVEVARERVEDARASAYASAMGRFTYPEVAREQIARAELKVLLELACRGRTDLETQKNLAKYWDEVRKEIES